jgi:hypothetical protein
MGTDTSPKIAPYGPGTRGSFHFMPKRKLAPGQAAFPIEIKDCRVIEVTKSEDGEPTVTVKFPNGGKGGLSEIQKDVEVSAGPGDRVFVPVVLAPAPKPPPVRGAGAPVQGGASNAVIEQLVMAQAEAIKALQGRVDALEKELKGE